MHHGANALTRFAPSFTARSCPRAAPRYPIRTVLVRAAYHDNKNGTGVQASAVRLTVDGKSRTAAAHITASGLHLYLTKLANGTHTTSIVVRDTPATPSPRAQLHGRRAYRGRQHRRRHALGRLERFDHHEGRLGQQRLQRHRDRDPHGHAHPGGDDLAEPERAARRHAHAHAVGLFPGA